MAKQHLRPGNKRVRQDRALYQRQKDLKYWHGAVQAHRDNSDIRRRFERIQREVRVLESRVPISDRVWAE